MEVTIKQEQLAFLFEAWKDDYVIYGPKRFADDGCFSDTDTIRYGEISGPEEIVFDEKSQYSFKEALLPAYQTLFYFTEDAVKEADGPEKEAIVFLRSCDLHSVKRLDEIYLSNGPEDFYYKRLREKIHFVWMSCPEVFENCFCQAMGTDQPEDYDMGVKWEGGMVKIDCRKKEWVSLLEPFMKDKDAVEAKAPLRNTFEEGAGKDVRIPESLSIDVAKSDIWRDYDGRCIACGRCNFVCPTCTCFTMQDLFYSENGRAGERRRVWASCMVDGYTDVAGGGSYRQKNGERMRFKVLHKILDYKQRNGYHMCVGCGRCDDVCPEYISFSDCINKLEDAMKEVSADDE